MSLYLNRFIERLQGFEARGAKDFIMPIGDAKGLHADLTRLLLELTDLKEKAVANTDDQVITVNVGGGGFK